jgi:maltose alpha-D-glucosyltransferase/alpha-amylase
VHPVIEKGYFSYEHVNVEDQRRDPDSLLNWMTALIRLRKECPEFGLGDWEIIESKFPGVLIMRYQWKKGTVMTVHNFSDKPCEVVLPAKVAGDGILNDLMRKEEVSASEKQQYTIDLDSYGYRWFRLME